MPLETKLRDVIIGVLTDDFHTADLHIGTQAEIATMVIRRLQHAESIELDDGTLFVRRAPIGEVRP